MIYMSKKIVIRVLSLLIVFFIMGIYCFNDYCYASVKKTLILYDHMKTYGEDANVLNELVKLKLSKENEIDIKKLDLDAVNKIDELNKYDEIYVFQIDKNTKEQNLINEKLNELNTHVHYLNESLSGNKNESKSEATKEVYYYLDNVTPFDDLNMFIEKINYINEKGIKCFIEATPVFINENLDGMKNFCEALRYAESYGNKIVLNWPVINNKGAKNERPIGQIINENLSLGFKNYVNYWVYPVALSAEDEILYSEDYKNTLDSSDTLFLNMKSQSSLKISGERTIGTKSIILKMDSNDYLNNIYNDTLYLSEDKKYAVCINNKDSFEEFKSNLDKVMKKGISENINSNNLIESNISFADYKISSSINGIMLNDINVTKDRFISKEEFENTFNKEETTEENSVMVNLSKSNKLILSISFISLGIFILILIASRNIERKKFFK